VLLELDETDSELLVLDELLDTLVLDDTDSDEELELVLVLELVELDELELLDEVELLLLELDELLDELVLELVLDDDELLLEEVLELLELEEAAYSNAPISHVVPLLVMPMMSVVGTLLSELGPTPWLLTSVLSDARLKSSLA